MSSFSSSTQLAKQHHLAQLITSCFLKHFLGLNATLLFSSSLMAHITLSLTVMKKVMHILSQSQSQTDILTETDTVTKSQGHRFSQTRAHLTCSGSLPSLRLCTCWSLPRAFTFSFTLQPEHGPTWVPFTPLCPHGAKLCSPGQS